MGRYAGPHDNLHAVADSEGRVHQRAAGDVLHRAGADEGFDRVEAAHVADVVTVEVAEDDRHGLVQGGNSREGLVVHAHVENIAARVALYDENVSGKRIVDRRDAADAGKDIEHDAPPNMKKEPSNDDS